MNDEVFWEKRYLNEVFSKLKLGLFEEIIIVNVSLESAIPVYLLATMDSFRLVFWL